MFKKKIKTAFFSLLIACSYGYMAQAYSSTPEVKLFCEYKKVKTENIFKNTYYSGDQDKSTLPVNNFTDISFPDSERIYLTLEQEFLYYKKNNTTYDLEKNSRISANEITFEFDNKKVHIDRKTGNSEMILTQDIESSKTGELNNIEQKYIGKCIIDDDKRAF